MDRRTQGFLQRIGGTAVEIEVEINGWGCLILVFLAALIVIASFGSQPIRPPF